MRSLRSVTPVACVILAAGMSKRFGEVKQLAEIQVNKPIVQNAVDIANASRADQIILVVGSNSSKILAKVNLGRAQTVLNRNFKDGLSTSVKAGLESVPPDCLGALFMVADQPFLTSHILNKMIDTFATSKCKQMVALSTNGEPRNPVLIPRGQFEEVSKLFGDIGAREVVRAHLSEAMLINVDDENVFLDIDSKSNLRKAKSRIVSST